MIHYALPVGELLRGSVSDHSCVMCGSTSETLHHVFWECVAANIKKWFRILRLLGRKYSRLFSHGVKSSGKYWNNKWLFIIIIILPCLYM